MDPQARIQRFVGPGARRYRQLKRWLLRIKKRHAIAVVLLVSLLVGTTLFLSTLGHSGGSSSSSTGPGPSLPSSTSGGIASTSSSAISFASSVRAVNYTLDSPATGQWIWIRATRPVQSVVASNTGAIPSYGSLADLNQTVIGYECVRQSADGGCASMQYLQQTGWFWDKTTGILTVHYLGGKGIELAVKEQP